MCLNKKLYYYKKINKIDANLGKISKKLGITIYFNQFNLREIKLRDLYRENMQNHRFTKFPKI